MGFRTWVAFIVLLIVVYQLWVSATPPAREYPQALPPTMVTGLLGVLYPTFILKLSAFEMAETPHV